MYFDEYNYNNNNDNIDTRIINISDIANMGNCDYENLSSDNYYSNSYW